MNADPRRTSRVIAVVSALGAGQAVAIITQISALADAVGNSPFGAGPGATIVIGILSSVFLVVAMTVTAVVVAGASEVVITGQLEVIALRRLLGASASAERARLTHSIVRRALLGMVSGAVLGYSASAAVLAAGLSSSHELRLTGAELTPSPMVLIVLVGQYLVVRGAVRRGTRGVLDVPAVTALRLSAEADAVVPGTLGVGRRASFVTAGLGLLVLGAAVAASPVTPLAMLPAVVGGVVSFIGMTSIAPRFVPRLVDVVGRLLGRSLPVTLARRSLVRHGDRTSRAVLAVAGPVTLVTTFGVGIATFDRAVRIHYATTADAGRAGDVLSAVVTVVWVLAAFLFVTAAVALGNAASFSAWSRRRETALIRVLGQSSRATSATTLMQSLMLALTAALLGLVLGVAYGWIGTQCVFGAIAGSHLVVPVLPVPVLLGAVGAVGVLTVAASWAPIRATLRQPPIRAYLAG